MPTLLLLRHAEAAAVAPGRHDTERPLTDDGLRQASAVGEALRIAGHEPDLVISSSALRTQQTAEALELDAPVQVERRVYNAGSDTILEVLHEVVDEPDTVLVVGHAPGIPALVHDLADPDTSEAAAVAAIDAGYPTATLCRLEFNGPWAELRTARLVRSVLARQL